LLLLQLLRLKQHLQQHRLVSEIGSLVRRYLPLENRMTLGDPIPVHLIVLQDLSLQRTVRCCILCVGLGLLCGFQGRDLLL
jgi:hypothetical protein